MKENILDVLMYLFENYMDDDNQLDHDQDTLKIELVEAGFPSVEVNKAFAWLEGLAEQQTFPINGYQGSRVAAMRAYLPEEMEKLDVDCRGFLLFLEQVGVLDTLSRELVIDRAMALDTDDFNLEQLKWVILMVLFNQPGQEAAFTWMEELIYEEIPKYLH